MYESYDFESPGVVCVVTEDIAPFFDRLEEDFEAVILVQEPCVDIECYSHVVVPIEARGVLMEVHERLDPYQTLVFQENLNLTPVDEAGVLKQLKFNHMYTKEVYT